MKDLRRAMQQIRKKGAFLRGLLGDMEGHIAVSGRPGYYYVRLEKPGGYEVGIFQGRVRPLYNLPVRIETHPLTLQQFIAGVDEETLGYGGGPPVPSVDLHANSHGWGGDDQVNWLHTLQLFPLRCQPEQADPDAVAIQGGVYLAQGELSWLAQPLTVDLGAHRITGTRFVIVALAPDGAPVVTPTAAARIEDIDGLDGGGNYLVAAVRLRRDHAIAYTDIADLRFMNGGLNTALRLDDLLDVDAAAPNDGDALVWDAGNEVWKPGDVTPQLALDDLTDVDAAAPNDGDALVWDAGNEVWKPGDVAQQLGLVGYIEKTGTRDYETSGSWQNIADTDVTFTPVSGAVYKVTFVCTYTFYDSSLSYNYVRAAIDGVAVGTPEMWRTFSTDGDPSMVLSACVVFVLGDLGTSEVTVEIQTSDAGIGVKRRYYRTLVMVERVG